MPELALMSVLSPGTGRAAVHRPPLWLAMNGRAEAEAPPPAGSAPPTARHVPAAGHDMAVTGHVAPATLRDRAHALPCSSMTNAPFAVPPPAAQRPAAGGHETVSRARAAPLSGCTFCHRPPRSMPSSGADARDRLLAW
jgi:hypothetical protein